MIRITEAGNIIINLEIKKISEIEEIASADITLSLIDLNAVGFAKKYPPIEIGGNN